jgi:PAS domain S-box-containing protein
VIVGNGIAALIALAQVREATTRTGYTLQAIVTVKQVEDLVEDSSLDLRSYRMFGDPQELTSYRQARAELPEALQRLRGLMAEDASRSARLDQLTSLISEDTAALAASEALNDRNARTGGPPADVATSIQRTRAIEAAVGDLLADEERVLGRHLQAIGSYNTVRFVSAVLVATGSIALIGIFFALTRRDLRRSERLAAMHWGALRESEQRFHRIFDESPLGILLAYGDGENIVQVNPAFCRMLGFDMTQVVGRALADLAHVNDRAVLIDAIRRGTDPDRDVEVRFITRTQAIAWGSVRLTRLSASSGRPGMLLALTEDVTSGKRVEAELRQAQKMEAIGQLTGGIAHDFNNLLGVIIGNVEFLIDTLRDKDEAELAKEILNSALSGADLTRRLLAFARRQALQPQQIDLNAYLPNHIAIVRRLLGESITITTTLGADLWPTRADPSQVGDALLNLAINARDAMPHGGTISIATANASVAAGEAAEGIILGDYVVLSVSDTGTGMAPEVLDRAIEPFFTTKPPGAGSGLGLSMIFGFAKQSGGHLRIDSELGHGTMVRLYLPRAHGVEPVTTDTVADAPLPQGNEQILLVDDNTEMRSVARRHLVSLGYRVGEADSGPAALQILQADRAFDLLFTDVVMPDGMTGHQLAAAAQRLRPGLKVLFTTGYFRAEPVSNTVGAMIRKPYRRHELAASVRAALEA